METVIDATQNPDMVNQLVSQMEQAELVRTSATDTPDGLYDLPDTFVTLPGGLLDLDGSLVTEAEVRELTGEDEEALARVNQPGKLLLEILNRGVIRIGDERATRSSLDALLAGDRDALLLAIRRATFGDTVEYRDRCPECSEFSDFEVNLKSDIPVRALDKQSDRQFTVECRVGKVEMTLPTGVTQRDLMSNPDRTVAEINTALLAGCVMSINGMPSMGASSVKKLGIRDREELSVELAKRTPGPQLNSVKKECPECGGEVTLALSLAALFLG